MKLVISPEDFKAHGSYHFSYPLLVERYKKGEALVQPHPTTEKDDAGKKKKKVIRKGGEDDYDIDDPFIDDCQVTTQFESIFQLMSGEGESADPSLLNQDLNFYIYRGPLQVDIIEKEFDPVKRKKKKTKKAIKKTENTAKPAVEKKKATASMEVKKKKREKPEKLSTLTEQIKEMEDKMDTVGIKTNPSTKKPSPIKNQPTAARKQYDTDNQVAQCEYTEVLEEFSKQAASIVQFDPAKFPNALRPQLEAVILAYLRIDSNFSEWKDTLFDTLATKIPYAAGSLKRLALKKVLPMMLPTEEKLATSVQVVNNEARILVDAGKIIEGKAKFSETLREAIYSHVRLEIAKVIIERAILISEGTTPAPSSINLQDVKRNAFKQNFEQWPSDQWKVSTGDISKEFSAYKRKIDQRMLRKHNIKLEDIVISPPTEVPISNTLERTLFSDEVLVPPQTEPDSQFFNETQQPDNSFNSTAAVFNETSQQMMEE